MKVDKRDLIEKRVAQKLGISQEKVHSIIAHHWKTAAQALESDAKSVDILGFGRFVMRPKVETFLNRLSIKKAYQERVLKEGGLSEYREQRCKDLIKYFDKTRKLILLKLENENTRNNRGLEKSPNTIETSENKD